MKNLRNVTSEAQEIKKQETLVRLSVRMWMLRSYVNQV